MSKQPSTFAVSNKKTSIMRTTLFTKDVSVERVTPPALLGNCKAVGKSEREVRTELAQEFDGEQKRKWRRELFVQYAHRLLECSEKIFADERLFFTPLPLPLSGWAKSGVSYESRPLDLTLGHIVAWWQSYNCSQVEDAEGRRHYIYGFAFGTQCKFGYKPNEVKPDRVLFIGANGQGYRTEIDKSLLLLGSSLYEVCCQYPKPPLCSATFDLEDAIEHLLGERVYQRL